jgi:DNA repair exonuclease SbcCD ATPase subunit
VADELGAIRRVWIELFEDANFDIEMLRNKLHEGSADVTRLETELLDVVQELGSLKERLALTRPEEDNAHALAHDEVEADLHDKAKLQLQQAEGLKMIEDTKKALETTQHAHVSETRALADEQMQLELLEEEEQSLQAEVTDVVQALTEAEHGLAQAVEQEEQIVHQLVVHENVSATAEVHLEQLTEVLYPSFLSIVCSVRFALCSAPCPSLSRAHPLPLLGQ